jgi:sec-independent protein translocase protein TatB
MFDIGFSELVVIAVVALIVIGPERLPRVARTVGALLGRFQRYVNDVKSEVRREMELEDLQKFRSQLTEQVREVEQTIHKELRSAEDVARSTVTEVVAVADDSQRSAHETSSTQDDGAVVIAPPTVDKPTQSP